jgi:hypothetical protein
MEGYQHILFATENLDSSSLKAASKLGQRLGIKRSLIHTCQYLDHPNESYLFPSRNTMKKRLFNSIKRKLAEVGKDLGIAEDNQSLEVGNPNTLLLSKAYSTKADLLVIETQRSNPNNNLTKFMLKNSVCDILAVKS